MFKVLKDGDDIVNCEETNPQYARMIADGAEELPDIFNGLEQYANTTNTTKVDDVWTFDASLVTPVIVAQNEAAAKRTRDTAIVADIGVHGVLWQVRDSDRMKMSEVITTAASQGYPPETTQSWILADNTTRDTTAAELQAVLDTQVLRQQPIFEAYAVWRAGDKLTPFSL